MEAILFDLDDTLVDFQYSRRHGLRAVQALLPALAPVPLEELELVHDGQLHANYLRTLGGSLTEDEARLERMRGICGPLRAAAGRKGGCESGCGVRARAAVERAPGPGRSRACSMRCGDG